MSGSGYAETGFLIRSQPEEYGLVQLPPLASWSRH